MKPRRLFDIRLCIVAICLLGPATGVAQNSRREVSLDGAWQLTANGETREVVVPGTFEKQIAADFDGVGVYERQIAAFEIPEHHRLLVRFEGASTETVVWFNGTQVGSHLGAWTPFKFDVTDLAHASRSGPWQIKVQVDEKVGHNTQGFLPVIQPHFGGLWQSAHLEIVPEAWIDVDRLMAIGDRETGNISLQIPVGLKGPTVDCRLEIDMGFHPQSANEWAGDKTPRSTKWFMLGQEDLRRSPEALPKFEDSTSTWNAGLLSKTIPTFFEKGHAWSPTKPQVFQLRIRLRGPATVDEVNIPVAFRSIKAQGDTWLLNGNPLMIRGVLNWGYAPPLTSPSLDEAWMRNEIETAKSYGFNLMKFCLWVPPKRYLELCDELGMLAWVEYPTWHPQLTQEHLDPLRKEYSEFFAYDRNHPSVILRSLTCETGSGAELDVIQSLYDLCKQQIPGAIVEDDSSWIEWNRVSDFYDDHPYGNNHTWPATLDRLNKYISERKVKPLILGEAIAADTWTSPRHFEQWSKSAAPHHQPGFLADNFRWLMQFLDDNSPWLTQSKMDDELSKSSRQYAMLMRKYQIEAYRRLVPQGGYVVSVIRDFPLAGMGLIDYAGAPKWTPEDWSFHGETMLLLATENDRRSFFSNEPISLPVAISHFGSAKIENASLRVAVSICGDESQQREISSRSVERLTIEAGKCTEAQEISFDSIQVSEPTPAQIRATLTWVGGEISNQWTLWVFPTRPNTIPLVMHPSLKAPPEELRFARSVETSDKRPRDAICAGRLDQALLDHVAQGGSLLLLPNGERGSFSLEDQWFLRGGPAVFSEARESLLELMRNTESSNSFRQCRSWRSFPQAFVELQHFDLAGPVVPNVDTMLDDIVPLWMLWDNHDRTDTRTHGLLFEIPVGRGWILVSTLDTHRPTNAAGQWILGEATHELLFNRPDSVPDRGGKNLRRLRAELDKNEIELQSLDWKFQPDPNNDGEKKSWQGTDFNDSDWKTIKADRHWEGQGYDSLDNWAWYRLRVPLDEKWAKAEKLYLNFTGVDDHYRLFINGQFVGSSGDVATKKTAFDERKGYDITEYVGKSDSIQIAIAVYDWYGAGGIFRPVTLSTQPLSDDRPWLK